MRRGDLWAKEWDPQIVASTREWDPAATEGEGCFSSYEMKPLQNRFG
ncbi:uncharacterized protein G2W53_037711 [Senna tora]|uniref:Uncharacterized protein n=1 Tax=Senna tora TaxID=362788 RepID=A0A834W1G1_9FABA|nr:uncharacterized protein G2W53_037711 [Senna tora]